MDNPTINEMGQEEASLQLAEAPPDFKGTKKKGPWHNNDDEDEIDHEIGKVLLGGNP